MPRLRPLLLSLAAAAVIVLGAASPAVAQGSGGGPASAASVQELRDLVNTIQDAGKREKLVRQLQALIAASRKSEAGGEAAPEGGLLARLSEHVRNTSEELLSAIAIVFEKPQVIPWIRRQISDPAARAEWLGIVEVLALILAAGFAAEWILRMLLYRPRRAVEGKRSDTLWLRVPLLLLRTLIDLLPLAGFAVAAYSALPVLQPDPAARAVALAVINAYVLARAILVAGRMILTPDAGGLRVMPFRDETASYLYVWIRRTANVAVYGYFAIEAARLLGLPSDVHLTAQRILGIVVTAMAAIFLLQNRRPVAAWLKGHDPQRRGTMQAMRNRAADVWHVFAVAYVIGIYVVWALAIPGGFLFLARATGLTAFVLLVAVFAARSARRGLDRIFRINDDIKARFPGLEARANRYLPALHAVVRWVITLIAALAVLQAWGIDTFGWIGSESGRAVISSAVSVAIVVVGALVAWEAASAMIERYLERAAAEEASAERSARIQTLLPLARKTILIALIVMVTLIVLSQLGINIAPLLAGAGVVGLAIGFGAQTLVKDVITGLFILIEDTIAVGHIVSVAGHTGVVEGLSIRSIRLRDLEGIVHTVPFSEVTTVQNYTKEYSYYLFEVGIAYRENVDEVIPVLRELADRMREDEQYGPYILDPLEVLGLDRFGDSAVIIKTRLKTRPGYQWMVGREYNRRMKARFDEMGIEIPFPHTTLYFGQDKDGAAPPAFVEVRERQAQRKPARRAAPAEGRAETVKPEGSDQTARLPGDGE